MKLEAQVVMRLKFHKWSATKFVSRIIQIAKGYWKLSQERSGVGLTLADSEPSGMVHSRDFLPTVFIIKCYVPGTHASFLSDSPE